MTPQVETRYTTIPKIMRSAAFQRGVAEVRAGRPPDFDGIEDGNDAWDYERGRQWAVIAPRMMPVMKGRKVNPQAVALFNRSDIR